MRADLHIIVFGELIPPSRANRVVPVVMVCTVRRVFDRPVPYAVNEFANMLISVAVRAKRPRAIPGSVALVPQTELFRSGNDVANAAVAITAIHRAIANDARNRRHPLVALPIGFAKDSTDR